MHDCSGGQATVPPLHVCPCCCHKSFWEQNVVVWDEERKKKQSIATVKTKGQYLETKTWILLLMSAALQFIDWINNNSLKSIMVLRLRMIVIMDNKRNNRNQRNSNSFELFKPLNNVYYFKSAVLNMFPNTTQHLRSFLAPYSQTSG